MSILSAGIGSLICLASSVAEQQDAVGPEDAADRRCRARNWRAGMPSVPATGLRNVRTIGMNRASTTALAGPNFSK